MPSDRTLAYGKRVAEALLGLDALYRQESKDGDGLVVLNMDTAGELSPDTFPTYGEAGVAFTQLREEGPGGAFLPIPVGRLVARSCSTGFRTGFDRPRGKAQEPAHANGLLRRSPGPMCGLGRPKPGAPG
ncbi:MAG: hypothetical protein ABIF09_14540 [Gemmatimonadota bacterium]